MVAALATDYLEAELKPEDRAMLDFAIALTRDPGGRTEADVERLRSHGFDDTAIHDIAQVTGLFNYFNRVADGLGLEVEPASGAGGSIRQTSEPG